MIDWIAVSGAVGALLPLVIEYCSKNVTGKNKVLLVLGVCFVIAIIQHGVDGGFTEPYSLSVLGVKILIITVTAVNMWNQMWKQFFPDDPNPVTPTEVK